MVSVMEHAEANGGGGEAEPGEMKPDQLELITSMLASMRAEQSEQAGQQSEQARRQSEQAQRQAEHTQQLMEVLQSSLGSLRAKAQIYTDRSCESVRDELEQNLQAVKGD
ncbi:hypothetical protein E2C01_093417 [Portunus trituberculatus]|uniref:Uncharacterized protein n=1 Tax=Portunus trituberculatus TaxID=210409 RepID=A0A5B7JY83_PORTR|nr:hypothetical protein [Portunus trituberculatus]